MRAKKGEVRSTKVEARARRRRDVGSCLAPWLLLICAGLVVPAEGASVPDTAAQAGSLDGLAADPIRGAAQALAAGLDAGRAGELERASALLAEAARDHPIVADYAQLERARLLFAGGHLDGAIAAAREGLAGDPSPSVRRALQRLVGDAFAAAGRESDARRAWEQALAASPPSDVRAAVLLELAASLERSADLGAAAERYRELWIELPTRPEARTAAAALERLEARLGRSLRDARDLRRRADTLLRRNHSGEALVAYDAALAQGLPARAARRARDKRAHCLFRLRRYPEAVKAFEALGDGAEARFWRARSLARSGRIDESVAAFEALAKDRTAGPLRFRARYLAGLLLEDEGDPRAREAFRAVLRGASGVPSLRGLASGARWHLGWADYLQGRNAEARSHFEALSRSEADPVEQLRARYWLARTVARDDPERGRERLAALVREFPMTYYGWRAHALLPPDERPTSPGLRLPDGSRAIPPRALARPRILLGAGLQEGAHDELSGLARRARGLDDRLALAGLYAGSGDFNRAQRLIVDAYKRELARGPASGSNATPWRVAWPTAFDGLVQSSRPGNVEPALVWAIMREESGYRPEVVSIAGARGLLQIMPQTGERLARDLGLRPFTPDDLFRPEINIRLGATYLDQLKRRFPGRASAAIGSYNAGPEAVARWLGERPDQGDDEWVESMPYQQTRTYVKRVLRSLHAYRELY